MKNYDGSPKLQNSRAVAKTTWLELEQSAHAVVEALERENPNYLILNESVASNIQYYSNQTLYDADVIHVGYDPNTLQAFTLYSGSALRLHRGLLAKQDPTYVFFGSQNEWLLIGGIVEDYVAEKYPVVDKLCQSLSVNNPTTV